MRVPNRRRGANLYGMAYDYDVAVIGLGPAGMAVSVMASEMGLKVIAVEAKRIGGECMNVGCIPSKALLRAGKVRHMLGKLEDYGLRPAGPSEVADTFPRVRQHLKYISEKKTMSMFDKVELLLGKGSASFVDSHTLQVGERRFTAKRIFICVGTRPALPDIEGMDAVGALTNENLFDLDRPPQSLLVIGSGAIACEMAQAFSRLGSSVTMVMRGEGLLWREDEEACRLVAAAFAKEGVKVLTGRRMTQIERRDGKVVLHTAEDGRIVADEVLSATGRRMDFDALNLTAAGVKVAEKGIKVNRLLQTSRRNIYAVGDCNGYAQLSHAAMHQGMIALMNAVMPVGARMDFRKYVVPWTVFTEPQLSHVGPRESELKARKVKYESIVVRHEDYGAAIAENLGKGFVKVLVSPAGRIYSATIVGEGSGEMINEWGLAIQQRIRMHRVMMLQHSFPTMSFLCKRAAETWMMNRMKSPFMRKMARLFYRL